MKSERRHELKENELSDWLEKSIDAIAPYTKAILGGLVAIVVAFLAYTLWQSQAAAAEQANWDQFYAAAEATDAEAEMVKFADAHPSEPAGLWARLYAADSQLAEGTQNLFTNRAAARPKLKEAVENYQAVAENAGKYEALVERAIYGQAKAYEALGEKSDLDAAQKLYQQLVEQFAGGALAVDAEKRVADLKQPATKEFYDWFVKATPSAPPTTGTPGIGPAFDPANVPTPPSDTPATVEPGFDPFKQSGAATPPTDLAPADSGLPTETPAPTSQP
jgi:hypothetical protein